MRRKQPGVFRLSKTVVQQQDNAPVLRRADDSPRRLQDLVHAGVAVGVVEAAAVQCVVVTAQHLRPGVHLRQPDPHDGAADETVTGKVYALTEDAAHHAEAQQSFFGGGNKSGQKLCPSGVVQPAFLYESADVRVSCRKVFVYLPQVGVAWEKGKIVSDFALRKTRQCIRNSRHTGTPVAVAGGDIRQAVQAEIFCGKGAVQRHSPGIGAAQYAPVITRRSERGTEQRCAAPGSKAGVHKGRRVETEQMQFQLTAVCSQLGDKMAVVPLGGAGNVLYRKVQLQQLRMGICIRVCFQPVLQFRLNGTQRSQQCGR